MLPSGHRIHGHFRPHVQQAFEYLSQHLPCLKTFETYCNMSSVKNASEHPLYMMIMMVGDLTLVTCGSENISESQVKYRCRRPTQSQCTCNLLHMWRERWISCLLNFCRSESFEPPDLKTNPALLSNALGNLKTAPAWCMKTRIQLSPSKCYQHLHGPTNNEPYIRSFFNLPHLQPHITGWKYT